MPSKQHTIFPQISHIQTPTNIRPHDRRGSGRARVGSESEKPKTSQDAEDGEEYNVRV